MVVSNCTQWLRGRRCRDCMIVGFTTTYAISVYHHKRCEFESRSGEVYSIPHYVIKVVSDLQQIFKVSAYAILPIVE